jgi:hypothetical protein
MNHHQLSRGMHQGADQSVFTSINSIGNPMGGSVSSFISREREDDSTVRDITKPGGIIRRATLLA